MGVKSCADSSPLFTTLHPIDFSAVYKGIGGSENRKVAQVNFNKALRKLYLRLKPNSKKA